MYVSILLMSCASDLKDPLLIACLVMMPNQVFIWLIHELPFGV